MKRARTFARTLRSAFGGLSTQRPSPEARRITSPRRLPASRRPLALLPRNVGVRVDLTSPPQASIGHHQWISHGHRQLALAATAAFGVVLHIAARWISTSSPPKHSPRPRGLQAVSACGFTSSAICLRPASPSTAQGDTSSLRQRLEFWPDGRPVHARPAETPEGPRGGR